MKVCPRCGFEESPFWRPAFSDIEKEIIEAENLKTIDPTLLEALHPGKNVVLGRSAYRLSKTGKWVQRMFLPLYQANGNSFKKERKYDGGKPKKRLEAALARSGMIPMKEARLDEIT